MASVLARGIRFHVQRLGVGAPPTVFLHGLVVDTLASWYFTVAPHAARLSEVVLYDLRGHGLSEPAASGYAVADMVADLDAILAALGFDGRPVRLVGNSFGGLLALAFAARHPGRVAGLVLVDPHVGGHGWGEAMAEAFSLPPGERDRRIAAEFARWPGRESERKKERLKETARRLVFETTMVEDLRATPPLEEEALAAVDCPVLALCGERSDLLPDARRLARLLPRCEVRVYPGCTHSILWEATARLRREVVEWLARPIESRA